MSTDQPTPRVGDTLTTAELLTVHQRVAQGVTYRSPDRCRCGADVLPEDGEEEVSVRRDRALAEHQAAVLAKTRARPDAPHPAPADGDGVERAALLSRMDPESWQTEDGDWLIDPESVQFLRDAAAIHALAMECHTRVDSATKPSEFAAAFNAYADEHASPCHQPRPSITPGLARLLLGFLTARGDAAPSVPGPLKLKFDGGRGVRDA